MADAPMQVNPLHSLGMGMAIANDASSRAMSAEGRARAAELALASSYAKPKTDAKLKAERDQALLENSALKASMEAKDAMILEWMHSNEAFKRLARQYGKQIGVTDEQRQADFDNQVLDVAQEDPRFESTKKTNGARERLGIASKV